MCLYVIDGGRRMVARHDMIVYKAGNLRMGKYDSPYKHTLLSFGKKYVSKENGTRIKRLRVQINPWGKRCVVTGFHAYTKPSGGTVKRTEWNATYMFLCYIPKGAEYYIGEFNEIVSTEIVVCKQRNKFKRT